MGTTCLVLLSGGQDSTTCLYWARSRYDEVHAVSFDYGQRHREELRRAEQIAKLASVQTHWILPADALSVIGDSALVRRGKEIKADGGREDVEASGGLPTSFVPGRNALFFVIAGALAAKIGAKRLVSGVCQTDFSGYPDCRREFVDAMERALTLAMPSSCGPIMIDTPLMRLTKAESVKLADSLPGCMDALALSLTCYEGISGGCGSCPACELRAKGFAEAGVSDPARDAERVAAAQALLLR